MMQTTAISIDNEELAKSLWYQKKHIIGVITRQKIEEGGIRVSQ
jgi:hypothetical protein